MEDETCRQNAVRNLPLLSTHFVQEEHYKQMYLVFPSALQAFETQSIDVIPEAFKSVKN
jgi:hypothetical protein